MESWNGELQDITKTEVIVRPTSQRTTPPSLTLGHPREELREIYWMIKSESWVVKDSGKDYSVLYEIHMK